MRHKREKISDVYLRMGPIDVKKGKKWQGRVEEACECGSARPKSNVSEEANENKGSYGKHTIRSSPLVSRNSTQKKNF